MRSQVRVLLSPPKRKPVRKDGFFFLVWYSGNRTRTHLNVARMSATSEGLTELNHNFRCKRKCNSSPVVSTNHNRRRCRWYAQAPLGPFTSRAYRLIEFSFACVFCPTTANAVIGAPKAPLCKGSCQPNRLTEGLTLREQPLRAKSKILPTSPYTGEAFRCGGTGHS